MTLHSLFVVYVLLSLHPHDYFCLECEYVILEQKQNYFLAKTEKDFFLMLRI